MSAARRVLALGVVLAAVLLGGCVYNPYTGTYVPCCSYYGYPYYAYPYYRYPPPYYPSPYSYGPQAAPYSAAPPSGYSAPPAGQPPPEAYPNAPQPLTPPQPGAANYSRPGSLSQRFTATNVLMTGG
jgi:hypothetical protein